MPIKNKYTYNPLAGQFDQITDLSDLNDTDVEVTANGINKPLKDAIEDGDIGTSNLNSYNASIVHGKTIPLYDWVATPTTVAGIPTVPFGYVCAKWSPDGEIVAAGYFQPPYLRLFKKDRLTDTLSILTVNTAVPLDAVRSIAWSPDGTYLAVGLAGTETFEVYRRYGSDFKKTAFPAVSAGASGCEGLEFSPNGEFLAVANGSIHIYSVADSGFTELTSPAVIPFFAVCVGWSPDSNILSVGDSNAPCILNYQRSGTTFTKLADPAVLPPSVVGSAVWHPNGSILAVATYDPYILIYTLNAGVITYQQSISASGIDEAYRLSWSPDGKYLAVGHNPIPSTLKIYELSDDGVTYTDISATTISQDIRDFSWSPDQKYLAIAVSTFGSAAFTLFKTTAKDPVSVNKAPETKSIVGNHLSTQSYYGGNLLRINRFTSSGAYTLPIHVKKIMVVVVGGGGNGSASLNTTPISQGCGGGGGGYAQRIMYAHEITASVTVTVGGAGGTSSFGSFLGATGGAAGTTAALTATIGGNGGTATGTFDLFYNGNKGGVGQCGTYFHVSSGAGGHSALCAGGGAARKGTSAGAAQTGDPGQANTGGGGSGGAEGASTRGSGGAGGTGVVIVYEYGD